MEFKTKWTLSLRIRKKPFEFHGTRKEDLENITLTGNSEERQMKESSNLSNELA